MHGIRRAAVKASSLPVAPAIRHQTLRARALPLSLRTTSWKPQPTSSFLTAFRTFATESGPSERSATESAADAASQATQSLKGTAEATKDFASEATSDASQTADQASATTKEHAASATETIQERTSSTVERASNTVQGAAADIASGSPAPSAQPSPIRPEPRREDVKPSPNLYIGNLYFEVTQRALRNEFSRFGEVKNVKIVYDGRGLSKGFGYVEFGNTEQATAAMEALDQQIFEGRRMAVQYAIASGPKQQPANQDGFRHAPSQTLYIGNMSYEMSDKDLNDLFRTVKNVRDVRVAIDRRTGQPRGYAHADFEDVQSATKAAEVLKSKTFYGRTLRVDYTFSKSTSNTSPSSS